MLHTYAAAVSSSWDKLVCSVGVAVASVSPDCLAGWEYHKGVLYGSIRGPQALMSLMAYHPRFAKFAPHPAAHVGKYNTSYLNSRQSVNINSLHEPCTTAAKLCAEQLQVLQAVFDRTQPISRPAVSRLIHNFFLAEGTLLDNFIV